MTFSAGSRSSVFCLARRSRRLTAREREVLKLVAEGKSSKEIAKALFVTTKTVVWHRQSIMDKLNLRSVAELTKYAVRMGFTGTVNIHS